jgi:flavin reductase (DIM6/NTAB) family NADH-FMN oxidoreductase RutF
MSYMNDLKETHEVVEPSILYLGTPVVLVTTLKEDGRANIGPISSAWWLAWTCMLGFDPTSKTVENLRRTRECVLNLPSADLVGKVDKIARTTGSNPMPPHKIARGYRYDDDKFQTAGFTKVPAHLVKSPRIGECPIQLEAVVENIRPIAEHDSHARSSRLSVEVRIVRVHVARKVLMDGQKNRIDPVKWRPLIMSFSRFFGLGPELHHSRLAEIPESSYAPADFARESRNGNHAAA